MSHYALIAFDILINSACVSNVDFYNTMDLFAIPSSGTLTPKLSKF